LSPVFFSTPSRRGWSVHLITRACLMKRYSLLLPLLAVVFAVACTDSTSPANSHALLAPRNPDLGVIGNKPPPPVDAAIVITISSPVTFYGSFTGVYFANGTSVESAAAAQQIGDESLTFLGSAWLRLNNVQPAGFGATMTIQVMPLLSAAVSSPRPRVSHIIPAVVNRLRIHSSCPVPLWGSQLAPPPFFFYRYPSCFRDMFGLS